MALTDEQLKALHDLAVRCTARGDDVVVSPDEIFALLDTIEEARRDS